MTGHDPVPVPGSRFRVELIDGNGRSTEVGCAEVVFPALPARPVPPGPAAAPAGPAATGAPGMTSQTGMTGLPARVAAFADTAQASPWTHRLPDAVPAAAALQEPLLLRRATGGDALWHTWWAKASQGRAPKRRSVRVSLLAPDGERVVMRWRFREARPVGLHYSPLNALQAGLVIETLAVAFEQVEID